MQIKPFAPRRVSRTARLHHQLGAGGARAILRKDLVRPVALPAERFRAAQQQYGRRRRGSVQRKIQQKAVQAHAFFGRVGKPVALSVFIEAVLVLDLHIQGRRVLGKSAKRLLAQLCNDLLAKLRRLTGAREAGRLGKRDEIILDGGHTIVRRRTVHVHAQGVCRFLMRRNLIHVAHLIGRNVFALEMLQEPGKYRGPRQLVIAMLPQRLHIAQIFRHSEHRVEALELPMDLARARNIEILIPPGEPINCARGATNAPTSAWSQP